LFLPPTGGFFFAPSPGAAIVLVMYFLSINFMHFMVAFQLESSMQRETPERDIGLRQAVKCIQPT
jgi:hypothetical protein